MKLAAVSLRATAAAVALFAVSAAHADLTIPFAWTESNSVQTFTKDNLDSFDLVNLSVVAKGNASAKGDAIIGASSGAVNYQSYSFPITKIVIGGDLSIKSGQAAGSALYFDRTDDDTGLQYGLTLANFTIDYAAKKVLADITPKGGTVATQQPLYTFNVNTKLALKYKFPLTVTGHEVLDNLLLTDGAKDAFNSALNLPFIAQDALNFVYGTLTQDVSTNLRKKSISSTPYTAK